MTIINGHEIAGRMPLFTKENREKTIADDKNETRRVIKEQPNGEVTKCWNVEDNIWAMYVAEATCARTLIFQAPYEAGDIRVMCEPLEKRSQLYIKVRELARYADTGDFVTSNKTETGLEWRWKRDYLTSVHMPHEAARSLFRITAVRAERVQDISADDCVAEGVRIPTANDGSALLNLTGPFPAVDYITEELSTAFGLGTYTKEMEPDLLRAYFASLWDSINAKAKRKRRNPYTGQAEDCYASFPWEDIRETREKNGLPWYVIGNTWVFAYNYEVVE